MIKIITGPMFSGKSNTLLADYEKKYHKQKILLFKPKLDTRDYGFLKTRQGKKVAAILIDDLSEIKDHLTPLISTVFIDEANFLTGEATTLLDLSIDAEIDIIISGLNLTSEQLPFGIMPNLMAIADEIVFKNASCNDCNRDAIYTYYDGHKLDSILVGNDDYIALCSRCLKKRHEQKNKNDQG